MRGLIAGLFLASVPFFAVFADEPQAEITISVPQETFKVGAPITMDVKIKNITKQPIDINWDTGNSKTSAWRQDNLQWLDVSSKSSLPPEDSCKNIKNSNNLCIFAHTSDLRPLQPNDSVRRTENLNTLLTKPGIYRLQFEQLIGSGIVAYTANQESNRSRQEDDGVEKSNILEVTVTP